MNLYCVIIHFPEDAVAPQKSDNRTVTSFDFQPKNQIEQYLTNTNAIVMKALKIQINTICDKCILHSTKANIVNIIFTFTFFQSVIPPGNIQRQACPE